MLFEFTPVDQSVYTVPKLASKSEEVLCDDNCYARQFSFQSTSNGTKQFAMFTVVKNVLLYCEMN